MKLPQQQSGLSMLSMLCIALMLGFFAMSAIKIAPSYFEYLTIKEIITKVSKEHRPDEENIADIRRRIASLLNTNQIYDIAPKDIEVYRKEGKTYIDANYEARLPLIWRIDAVLKFDDLKFEAGSGRPL